MNEKRAIFLDRDGVINRDFGYVFKWNDFEFFDGAIDALTMLSKADFLLFIITNQSGIGRGYYSEADFLLLNKQLWTHLHLNGIDIRGIYHCPHLPEEKCICRKPSPYLILQAGKEHGINLRRSYMVGDKMSDVRAGVSAGVGANILIKEPVAPFSQQDKTYTTAENLYEAAKVIISNENTTG